MTTLSLFIGIIGNITSVLIFLSPIGTFWRIVKQGSTEEFESLPYICTLLNCTLWVYYGITKPGGLLIVTVNGFGTIVETIYIILFIIHAPPRMKVKTATLAGILDVGFLLLAVLVTRCAFEGEMRIEVIGILAAGLCITMYGSPLSAMRTVVRTKSLEYMPFFLSFSLFLNGAIWVLYSLLERDYYIGALFMIQASQFSIVLSCKIWHHQRVLFGWVSNGVGFVFGTIQLVLYALYRNAKPSSNRMNDGVEGGQNEHLITS